MAETVVSDAAKVPQDEGYPSISDGNETFDSAGLMALLGQAAQSGSYVRSDSELTFTSHDGTNDTVDVTAGVAYLSLAGVTVDVQSTQADVNDGPYDTTITTNTMPAVCVILPSATTVNLQDSTLSSIWLAYDTDGTGPNNNAGDVYLRSDDTGSVTAPSHPSVKLGEANPDNASADTLENRFPSPTYEMETVNQVASLAGWQDNGTNQTIADGTETKVDWVTTIREDSNVATVDTSNDTITIQQGGVYSVSAFVTWSNDGSWSTGDQIDLRLFVNGSEEKRLLNSKVGTSFQSTFLSPFPMTLSSNDVLDIRVRHNSGGDRDLNQGGATASAQSNFSVTRVG